MIKNKLKQNPILYRINAALKAKAQEHLAANELTYYKKKASLLNITIPSREVLSIKLKERLAKRNLHITPKSKGNLHIFLVYHLSNWEFILPIALKPFGRVSEFDWRSHGFDPKSDNWIEQRDSMSRAMLESFYKANSERPIDIVVGYLSGCVCDPEILREMAQAGAVIFNFNWDDKLHFRNSQIASAIDLNLTNAPSSCIKYTAHGGLSMFWPEAAHPEVHRPLQIPFEYDVSFVGKNYGWRSVFIKKIRKMGINVETFGFGWENGPLSNEEMVKLYSRSRINLGFAGVGHSKRLMCLKGRDFEVPMSGGLYLTQDNPELSLVYDVGKEIVTYMNEKDCAEKIKRLLAHPDEADKIQKAGRTRAMRDHGWEKRFEEIFRLVGIMK